MQGFDPELAAASFDTLSQVVPLTTPGQQIVTRNFRRVRLRIVVNIAPLPVGANFSPGGSGPDIPPWSSSTLPNVDLYWEQDAVLCGMDWYLSDGSPSGFSVSVFQVIYHPAKAYNHASPHRSSYSGQIRSTAAGVCATVAGRLPPRGGYRRNAN